MEPVPEDDEVRNPIRYINIDQLYPPVPSSPSRDFTQDSPIAAPSDEAKTATIMPEDEPQQGPDAEEQGDAFPGPAVEQGDALPGSAVDQGDAFPGSAVEGPLGKRKATGAPIIVYTRRRRKARLSSPRLCGGGEVGVDSTSAGSGVLDRHYGNANGPAVAASVSGAPAGKKRKRNAADCATQRAKPMEVPHCNIAGTGEKVTPKSGTHQDESPGSLSKSKKWAELEFDGTNPVAFVGLPCKIFWPMDDDWYCGSVTSYIPETNQHQVTYKDGNIEDLMLSKERIKFHITGEQMQHLNLKCTTSTKVKRSSNYDEMLALALSFDDNFVYEPGDIVWAKRLGYSMWPALVVEMKNKLLKPHGMQRIVHVKFFGTQNSARVKIKNVKPFFRGLLSSFHLKSKQSQLCRSLEEARTYLLNNQVQNQLSVLQKDDTDGDCQRGVANYQENSHSGIPSGYVEPVNLNGRVNTCPYEIGDLCLISLGKIVSDSEYFQNKHCIWPEGYKASRKFLSLKDPNADSIYVMEVLRNPKSKSRPLFRVTLDDGEQIEGPNPSSCWETIYSRIRIHFCNGYDAAVEEKLKGTGSYMFGFSNSKVCQLIQDLPNPSSCSKYLENQPTGYRAVNIDWKDLDRCNVCHTDEEYEDDVFLQCAKCRMLVHARCYGVDERINGVLWLCKFCRPGACSSPPPCCLCPVLGGAIKPTSDGRWAHLTCAMWIPETCLTDIKRMEPIDGINRINKDRWKLLCSICGVSYGACIQCSNNNCRVAYHPLCARAAGLCVELEDEDQLKLISFNEDDNQSVRLLSFCKKHRQTSNECSPGIEQAQLNLPQTVYSPPCNPSGSARCEPYNFVGRRGQKEPHLLAIASAKRLYIEDVPHVLNGYWPDGVGCLPSGNSHQIDSFSGVMKLENEHSAGAITSMIERYKYMKATYRKRLVFGKSRIHGFGVFTKASVKAGDMVVEYTGELVRPPIADIREHRIYNSLVGAGTYMFRIDNEHVVDATRAGSIAHLINHSCEPNCYSRTISLHGVEHVIIFAKRDINQCEELTYDYRFISIDEQLQCFCGFPRCRGVVNDPEVKVGSLWVPRCELTPWLG